MCHLSFVATSDLAKWPQAAHRVEQLPDVRLPKEAVGVLLLCRIAKRVNAYQVDAPAKVSQCSGCCTQCASFANVKLSAHGSAAKLPAQRTVQPALSARSR